MRQFQPRPPRWILAACLAFQGVASAQSPDLDEDAKFVRLINNAEGQPKALQTSVARYAGQFEGKPLVVDLVGAVHLADEAYYLRLNKLFQHYDAVLYEFVAPEGMQVPDPANRSANPLTFLQQSLRGMLGLESQIDHVDYAQPNFVHADMSPQEMSEAIRQRGDSLFSFMLSAMADLTRQANLHARELEEADLEAFDPIRMLSDPAAGQNLKVQMAKQFDRLGDTRLSLGATINELIVEDRNRAAIKVLSQQLAKGKTRLAIFYGAAHMQDFERRLMTDFGLKPVGTEWLTAWDLTRPVNTQETLTSMLFRALQAAE